MNADQFSERHLGPRKPEVRLMLETIGVGSIDELVSRTVPASIIREDTMSLPEAMDEQSYLKRIWEIATKNKLFKTYIGLGYYNTVLPPVIQRNVFENPNCFPDQRITCSNCDPVFRPILGTIIKEVAFFDYLF